MSAKSASPIPSEEKKKKSTQTKGLKPTAVARELRNGAEQKDIRVSAGAVKLAVEQGQAMLKALGQASVARLDIAGKKTVSKDVLVQCIKNEMSCKGLSAKQADLGAPSDKRKGAKPERKPIAVSSAVWCFGKGCKLQRGSYQISESAKASLSLITLDYFRSLGKFSASVATAAGRKTINSKDLALALEARA